MNFNDPALTPDALLQHAGWLRELARRLLGDGHLAEDVVQETFAAALTHPGSPPRDHRSWLAQVARNFALRRVLADSARARREKLDAQRRQTFHEAASRAVERAEAQRLLLDCVLELREPLRSCVLLRFYDDLPTSEVASKLGLSEGTVRSCLSRAKRILRERMDRRMRGGRAAWAAALAGVERAETAAPRGWGGPMLVRAGALLAPAAIAIVVLWLPEPSGSQIVETTVLQEAVGAGGRPASLQIAPADRVAPAETPVLAAAPIQLRLVDSRTAEALPAFGLEVHGASGKPQWVVSDASGTAVTDPLPWGTWEIRCVDAPDGTPGRIARVLHERSRSQEPHTLEIPVGPTFELELSGGTSNRTDLQCGLAGRAVLRPTQEQHPRTPPLFPVRAPDPERGFVRPWVRVHAAWRSATPAPPFILGVVSADGLWCGASHVRITSGRCAEPVRMQLIQTGALRGRILFSGAPPPIAMVARLRLLEPPNGADPAPSLHCDADSAGSYNFRGLTSGDYELWSHPQLDDAAMWGSFASVLATKKKIRIDAGQAAEFDLLLPELPQSLPIEGTVRSSSGKLTAHTEIEIRSDRDPELVIQTLPIRWEQEGATAVGYFESRNLPQGKYRVQPASSQHLLPSEPPYRRCAPGDRGVGFVIRDDVDSFDLHVRPYDLQTGRALSSFDAEWKSPGNQGEVQFDLSTDEPWKRRVPVGQKFQWSIRIDGYVPASGTQAALRRQGKLALLEVAMRRGFGATVRVLTEDGAPIADASVAADGVDLGRSDDAGLLEIELQKRPRVLTVGAEGFVLRDAEGILADGTFLDTYWRSLTAILRPER